MKKASSERAHVKEPVVSDPPMAHAPMKDAPMEEAAMEDAPVESVTPFPSANTKPENLTPEKVSKNTRKDHYEGKSRKKSSCTY